MRKSIAGLALIGLASMTSAQESTPPNPNPNMPFEERLPPPGTTASTDPAVPDEGQARLHIRDAGYSDVYDLKRDGAGWIARARQDGKQVSVRVEPDGTIRGLPPM